MAQHRIRPILTGYTATDKGLYCTQHRDVGVKLELPCFAFLIETQTGPVLVDTGMAWTERADWHHKGSHQPEGFAIHEQLSKLGIDCADIRMVVFTHLHWDHCYYMDKFVNARFIAHKIEYEFAINPIPPYYKSYEHPVLGFKPPFDGLEIETVDGEAEIEPGIRVFPTPGHSPGHQAVEVDTKEGSYIVCGDAIFLYENMDPIPELHYPLTPPGRFANLIDQWHSMEVMKARAKDVSFLLPCHEPQVTKRTVIPE